MTVKSMGEFDLEQLPHLLPLQNNVKPTRYPLHVTRLVMRGLSTTGLFFALLVLVVAGAMSGWMVWILDYPMVCSSNKPKSRLNGQCPDVFHR
jgi:hypothetical protein